MPRSTSPDRPRFDPASAPAVAILTVAAIAVFVADLAGKDTSVLVLDVRAFMGEPWRIVTTMLPHANALHLGFNLMWLVLLGSRIEQRVGTIPFFLCALLVDAGSGVAEYALAGSGVGLSGIGYGLVGFGWIARHDPRFAGLVDRRTALLFVGWFFLCIGATLTHVLPVANVAHAVGGLLGGILGFMVTRRSAAKRVAAGLALLAVLGAAWLGATTFRPRVNFSAGRGGDAAHLGWKYLDAHDDAAAEPFLREAVRMRPDDSSNWFNLAIGLSRLDNEDGSIDAFRHALALAPGDAKRADGLASALIGAGTRAVQAGDFERAQTLCEEGARLDEQDAAFQACLRMARARLKWREPGGQ